MGGQKAELAVYIIKHLIAKEINENTESDYIKFKEKIKKLRNEQHEIYMGNEEVINKVLTEYAEKIK